MARGVLDQLRTDFELRWSVEHRRPTDAMWLRYAGLCLDVAMIESGYFPLRFLGRDPAVGDG
jgi:hypothetical protein